jgi:hypothetical protein
MSRVATITIRMGVLQGGTVRPDASPETSCNYHDPDGDTARESRFVVESMTMRLQLSRSGWGYCKLPPAGTERLARPVATISIRIGDTASDPVTRMDDGDLTYPPKSAIIRTQ